MKKRSKTPQRQGKPELTQLISTDHVTTRYTDQVQFKVTHSGTKMEGNPIVQEVWVWTETNKQNPYKYNISIN